MTRPSRSRNRYTPGWSGSALRCSSRPFASWPAVVVAPAAIASEDRAAPAGCAGAPRSDALGGRGAQPVSGSPRPLIGARVAVYGDDRVDGQADQHEPHQLAPARLPHALAGGEREGAERERPVE